MTFVIRKKMFRQHRAHAEDGLCEGPNLWFFRLRVEEVRLSSTEVAIRMNCNLRALTDSATVLMIDLGAEIPCFQLVTDFLGDGRHGDASTLEDRLELGGGDRLHVLRPLA